MSKYTQIQQNTWNGEWNFSVFARVLKSVMAPDKRAGDFVQEMFERIAPDADKEISDVKTVTFDKYFSGNLKLSGIAAKVNTHIDENGFALWVKELDDCQIELLAKEISKYRRGVKKTDVHEICASIFSGFLLEAAQSKPVRKRKGVKSVDVIDSASELVLVGECYNKCPICQKILLKVVKKIPQKRYSIIPIDETKGNDLDNRIALCLDCAAKYSIDVSEGERKKLEKMKSQIKRQSEMHTLIDEVSIEENIGFILKKMQNAKIEAVKEQLNYNPTTVLNKIGDTTTLLVKVKAYNSVYYQMVENCVKKFKRTKIFDSDLFCKQIKRLFEDLEYLKDKEIIFNALVDWLVSKTQSDTKSTAEIIVSYFIQHCEAFRESAG